MTRIGRIENWEKNDMAGLRKKARETTCVTVGAAVTRRGTSEGCTVIWV